jgi:hypothetical protein
MELFIPISVGDLTDEISNRLVLILSRIAKVDAWQVVIENVYTDSARRRLLVNGIRMGVTISVIVDSSNINEGPNEMQRITALMTPTNINYDIQTDNVLNVVIKSRVSIIVTPAPNIEIFKLELFIQIAVEEFTREISDRCTHALSRTAIVDPWVVRSGDVSLYEHNTPGRLIWNGIRVEFSFDTVVQDDAVAGVLSEAERIAKLMTTDNINREVFKDTALTMVIPRGILLNIEDSYNATETPILTGQVEIQFVYLSGVAFSGVMGCIVLVGCCRHTRRPNNIRRKHRPDAPHSAHVPHHIQPYSNIYPHERAPRNPARIHYGYMPAQVRPSQVTRYAPTQQARPSQETRYAPTQQARPSQVTRYAPTQQARPSQVTRYAPTQQARPSQVTRYAPPQPKRKVLNYAMDMSHYEGV